jgi:hypothetical protein
MSDAFVIEAQGSTAGIVVRQDRGFRFYAATHEFNGLEGALYRRPQDAQRAAVALLADRRAETAPRRRAA